MSTRKFGIKVKIQNLIKLSDPVITFYLVFDIKKNRIFKKFYYTFLLYSRVVHKESLQELCEQ